VWLSKDSTNIVIEHCGLVGGKVTAGGEHVENYRQYDVMGKAELHTGRLSLLEVVKPGNSDCVPLSHNPADPRARHRSARAVWDEQIQDTIVNGGTVPIIDGNALQGGEAWIHAVGDGGACCNINGDMELSRLFDNGPSVLDSVQLPSLNFNFFG